jgi:LAO/AO transport system kinase
MVDTFLLLALAGAGDELQGIKRGILELIDILCVTKADGDNEARAKRAAAEHRAALHLLRGSDRHPAPPVLTASALTGVGVAEVWQAVLAHRAHLQQGGELEKRRAQQRLDWLDSLVNDELGRAFWRRREVRSEHAKLSRQIADDRISVTSAARRLLALAGIKPAESDGDSFST